MSEGVTPRIEDYGLLGDLQTAALVHRSGSIDWTCFPRFDSEACFAALLGTPDNGRWLLAPAGETESTRRQYHGLSLVLETVHETAEGAVRVIDFMPPRGEQPDIIRIVEGIEGSVAMRGELIIRFDLGRTVPWVQRIDHTLLAIAGPNAICLRTPVETHGENMTTISEFTVTAGQRIPFVLTWFPSHLKPPDAVDPEVALQETHTYWQEWESALSPFPVWNTEIVQSLLVLKSLTYKPTGGIVAAPTTSLPEKIGGVRNWDYRYCWLRDASLTLIAMLNAGLHEEATEWRAWLIRAIAGDPADLQIMYGIAGERRLDEWEVDWLPGFADSLPIRVGNAASRQLQLDVFGEVMNAAWLTLESGADGSKPGFAILRAMLNWLSHGWQKPDSGIWEVRGPARHFTHSKVMAWVAFDRAIRMHKDHEFSGPVEQWIACRDEIRDTVLRDGWNEQKQSFTQYFGGDELDASLLQMPIVGFLQADDPKVVATVAAIERELVVDGLLLRYRPDQADVDGLPGDEGVFLPCSFWLVEVWALQGRQTEADALFRRLLALRNDLGLLAEEYDPRTKQLLGNFPQAFTHLALVNAALALGKVAPIPQGDAKQSVS
jgi:GH15 family glucan-1,4-alpha-glucosidase